MSDYTSGAPLTVDTGDHSSPENTKHIVLQWKVDIDATRGLVTAETITFLYDEI